MGRGTEGRKAWEDATSRIVPGTTGEYNPRYRGTVSGVGSHGAGACRIPFAIGRNGVIATMCVALAARALLLDVNDFPRAADIAISTNDTSAGQRCKAEESNNTH
jgi:hypothetical protein